MGLHVIRVPDIGEGIAETEIAEWLVAPGDLVAEDQPLAAVMTDKATVEIPSPVAGRVVSLAVEAGSTLAVGADLICIEVAGEGNGGAGPEPAKSPGPREPVAAHGTPAYPPPAGDAEPSPAPPPRPAAAPAGAPLAAPSVRALARERGIDLRLMSGSGPEGRILREDVLGFDRAAVSGGPRPDARARDTRVDDIKLTGLRRRISQRMDGANRIPHITIIEEVDATELETLRQRLNLRAKDRADAVKLTLLPFVIRALVRAVAEHPVMNAHHDAPAGILHRFGGVHVGVATQTAAGLVVPVLRHAEARGLGETAREITRLADAARGGRATREELTGSTVTITSLGALGAIATTPILNVPEVAIVGINRMAVRPHWSGTEFVPRQMMNISCSFDHRVIDGWDAAVFVQRLKELLELPSLLFVEV